METVIDGYGILMEGTLAGTKRCKYTIPSGLFKLWLTKALPLSSYL
jgi:hypothetical protein